MFTKLKLLPLALACALVLALTGAYAAVSESSAAAPLSAAAAPDPLTCSGYPEPRVFLESQSWWTLPGRDPDGESEHIHLATCFPHAASVSGVVEFDVRVMLHHIKGTLNLVRAAIGSDVVTKLPLSVRCATADCTYWYKLKVDTAAWPYDGRQELRLTANVERDDGNRQYQSTGWQVYFANGKPVSHYRSSDLVIARGWYDQGYGYANATFEAPFLTGPVSGIWRPRLSFTKSRHFVSIDAGFHAGNPGTIVSQGSGSEIQPEIDTTKLTDGWHRLFIRADDVQAEGVNSGVLAIMFEVRNGGTPPPPPPPPPGDTQAPTAPTGLGVSSSGPSNVGLSWTASTDDTGVAGYDVYRDATLVATVTGTRSAVPGVDCATGHVLGVVAFDAAGNRSAKSTRSVRCVWTAG